MTRNEYIAIGAGVLVGLLLIRWLNRKTDASDQPAPAAPAAPAARLDNWLDYLAANPYGD